MTPPKKIGIYPGTFDPVTYGHIDIIHRAQRLVDELIIGIASNDRKGPLFSAKERQEIMEHEIESLGLNKEIPIHVKTFSSLLMNFAQENQATVLIRGIRAFTDFDYEFQIAGINAKLNPNIDTIFLMTGENHQFTSSRFVKEVCSLGGDVSKFVPPYIEDLLKKKYRKS